MTDTERRTQFIQGLRNLALFLETHPAIIAPTWTTFNTFVNTREELAAQARAGTWEKVYTDNWFTLKKSFGEDLEFRVNIERETVCRRVVTGKKIVPAQPEREVEEVTWECDDPSLLAMEIK